MAGSSEKKRLLRTWGAGALAEQYMDSGLFIIHHCFIIVFLY
jgi:hypothetical protein